jgi:DNA polymerase III delta subunit
MLYVYHGNDIDRRRQAVAGIKNQLTDKRPDAEVFTIDADQFTPSKLTELTAGRGLFEDKYIVFLYHVLTLDEGVAAVGNNIETMAEAEHVFVIIEDEITDDHLDALSDHARKVKKLHTEREDDEHEPWDLADALGNRDRRTGWQELQKALKSPNNKPESIQGLLWWQIRMIWLAKHTDPADEAGVSEYPYKKAKGFAKNFSDEELWQKTNKLISLYHESHRGEYELEDALEQFILEV